MKARMNVRNNRIVLSLVFLVLGFLIAYSYQITKKDENDKQMDNHEWERTLELQAQLIEIEEENLLLQNELYEKQQQLMEIEAKLAEEEEVLTDLANEAEDLRLILGKVKVKGEGIIVTLNDSTYDSGNINNFIVHEHHVLKVVNELFISGAEAVSINGKRLTNNSYIVCTGPVITVDGEEFPAPFVISAIGNPETLDKALNIQGGIKDQLVNDNIVVKIEKKNQIVMEPVIARNQ